MMEKTPNGIPYEWFVTSSNGARFILYPNKDATDIEIKLAKSYLWLEHDVVSIKIIKREIE